MASVHVSHKVAGMTGDIGVDINLSRYWQKFGNTTGGGYFINPHIHGTIGGGDFTNQLGSAASGNSLSFFNGESKSKEYHAGVGYALNWNIFTGGLKELSNFTTGIILRGGWGSNSFAFSMYNDVNKPPLHFGGGTDHGLTGTGELSFTKGFTGGRFGSESARVGLKFQDITGIMDKGNNYSKDSDMYKQRNNVGQPNKTSNNITYTKGMNKFLNTGTFGLNFGYSNSVLSTTMDVFIHGPKVGLKFQDPIHNAVKKDGSYATPWLFPYDENTPTKPGLHISVMGGYSGSGG